MPELPEVETIRAGLEAHVVGQVVEDVQVQLPRLIKNAAVQEFAEALTGKRILAIQRKGKYLLFQLSSHTGMLVHLRMTGSLIYEAGAYIPVRSEHIRFTLSAGYLLYGDVRTFGCFWLVPASGLTGVKGYDTLGPDAISPACTADYIYEKMKGSARTVKSLLLDQTVIAGLGNIYTDEALFLARVRPDRRVSRISRKTAERLYEAIVTVLQRGLSHGGTTIRDFVNGSGREGQNQHFLAVYGKKGMPCPICGTPVRYMKTGGRGTYFCPRCQH